MLTARSTFDAEPALAEARQLLAAGRLTETIQQVEALAGEPLNDAQRSQTLLIRGLAECRLAELSIDAAQRAYARRAIAAFEQAERLAGGIDSLDSRLTSPADFCLRRAQARMWSADTGEADLIAAVGRCAPGQESLRRQAIDTLIKTRSPAATSQLDELLARKDLDPSERLWLMRRRCRILAGENKLAEAERVLSGLLEDLGPGEGQDALEVQLAGVHLEAAESPGRSPGERTRLLDKAYLLLSAVQLRRQPAVGQEEVDAELNYLLGEVCLAQDRPGEAEEAFSRVLRLYPDSEFARGSRWGLARAAAVYRPVPKALEAYQQVVDELLACPPDPLVDRAAVQASLLALAEQFRRQSKWESAWQFLAMQYRLMDELSVRPTRADVKEMQGNLLRRLAMEEKRQAEGLSRPGRWQAGVDSAGQSAGRAGATSASQPDEQGRLLAQAHQHLRMAADAYLEAAKLAEADDNRGADNLERAADCYDEAGETARLIVVLRKFIHDYPTDEARVARAVFSLGKACQAAGQFEEAITLYLRMTSEYPNSPDANKSRVPMAQCHKALGRLDEAERILGELLADDQRFSPDSNEYRMALFELARLKYERGQYRQAIPRFDEALQRDGDSPSAVYYRYFLADSYRLSGMELDGPMASARTPLERQQLAEARTQWLQQAREQFDKVIAQFEARLDAGPIGELDGLYLRNSYFFRADCAFDLGDYERAVELYDAAALRYRDQPEAVAAYVQTVNCYLRLNRPDQARSANERAKWLLRKLPAEAFARRPLPLDKRYFAAWLEWAGQSGMW